MRGRRLAALAGALALVAGACDDGALTLESEGGEQVPDTFVIVPDGDGGAGWGGATGGGSSGGGTAPNDPGSPPGGGSGGSSGGSGGGSGGSGGGASPSITTDDRAGVGAMGAAYLRSEVPTVAIEVDATPGEALTNQARTKLRERIIEHGNKQSVGFVAGSALPEQDVYTTDQLRALVESHRVTWSSTERASIYVMVLSGRHEDESVVGVAFSASAFAIFPEQLAGGLLGLNYANFEEATVIHELGHLYGLVNLTGHGAFHEDPAHKGHSKNDTSVMFWAVESSVVEDIFTGGPPRNFDADDKTEIDAIRAAAG